MPLVPDYRAFTPASRAASAAMRRNRREGGKAERLLRSAVWRRGLRYRKHATALPGKPDMVFTRARVAVFCDGDFWHGRDWPRLREQLRGRANAAYWLPKIGRNRERDLEQTAKLERLGWAVLRFWEADLLKDPEAAAGIVEREVRSRAASNSGTLTYNML
ncbi:MAG: very short patch repair endonuclease [Dehalococcoidia bacterium]